MLWNTQRREHRYHIAVPVRLQGVDRDERAFDVEAWTLDVSANGACIHVPIDLDLPRRMRVVSENYQFLANATVDVIWERSEPVRRIGVTVVSTSPPPVWHVR
jgi:hypothetical protein